jgi:hypothetical protein
MTTSPYINTSVSDEDAAQARAVTQALYDRLQPFELKAAPLLQVLTRLNMAKVLNIEIIMYLGPTIEQALAEAERVSEQSRRLTEQCLRLTELELFSIPPGF